MPRRITFACVTPLPSALWDEPLLSLVVHRGAVGRPTYHLPRMTETDTRRIIDWIDSALELFRNNEGRLTAQEVRVLSMIAVARRELVDTLAGSRQPRASREQDPT
jgi:hypothetical protein